MCTYTPRYVLQAMCQVVKDLAVHGSPSALFAANSPLTDYAGYTEKAHYSAQMVFDRAFDRERLKCEFDKLIAEVGMDPTSDSTIYFDDSVPVRKQFDVDADPRVAGDAYAGAVNSNFKIDGRQWATYKIALHIFHSQPDPATGKITSVVHALLPSQAWDGTSCFNFMKELISRYCGNAPNMDVTQGHQLTTLTPEAKNKFDDPMSVIGFLLRLPMNIAANVSATMWDRASAAAGFEGHREGNRECALLNLSRAESARLAKACKTQPGGRVAPTAALLFAAIQAHKDVLGTYPYSVPFQASLQTRACAPSFPARRFIGDWLIGPLHYVRSIKHEFINLIRSFGSPAEDDGRYYTIHDAQRAYEKLLAELGTQTGSVRKAFHARVFGTVKGGAAAFEKAPTYADDNRLADSLFFNNYGRREVDERSGCQTFNWSGAGRVNCNCILVNGSVCIVFASSTLGLRKVEDIRDAAYKHLQLFMDASQ